MTGAMRTNHREIDRSRGRADRTARDGDSRVETAASSPSARRPIAERRAERELFFWTASMTLRLVAAIACTAYLVVAVAHGEMPAVDPLLKAIGGRN